MPHYRFFIESSFNEGDLLSFEGDEYHHMIKVMRLEQGDAVEIVNGQGYLGKGAVQEIKKTAAVCCIHQVIFEEFSPSFIIAQALLKPASLEWTIEKNTELGAEELWLFPAMYSEKKELSSNQLERLQRHVVSALKQCGRLYLPKICLFESLDKILQTESHSLLYGDLSPGTPKLSDSKSANAPLFIVGPEQGFHEKELTLLKRCAKGVSLHRNILRAETASITAAALLSQQD